MKQALLLIQRRLFIVTLISFAITPVIGYATASFFDMVELTSLFTGNSGLALIAIYSSLLLWCAAHFKNFLQPIINWKLHHPDNNFLPDELNVQLQSFGNRYWMFFLLYILTIPTIHHWFLQSAGVTVSVSSLLQFILLQLTITILVGLPGYLDGLSTLGKLTRYTGLSNVQVSMRTKMLLVGGYIPLLTTSILLKYYWWQTGFISHEVVLAWALMGLATILSTIVAYRSLTQSLKPVEMVTSNTGATSHADLAKQLQPHSNDEIGFLVQTLSRLFHRVGEQDTYVQAIVEHAAECIIVVNDTQQIEVFNPAAERLFGYQGNEICHRNLSWLLPNLTLPKENNKKDVIHQEMKVAHRNGCKLTVSMHISHMHMNDVLYYILLIADITESKATETMLLEAEERYRNLVVTAHDLVWSMDTQGRWTYLNSAAHHIYGYDAKELLNESLSMLQTKESKKRDEQAFASVLQGNELLGYETVHLDKDGQARQISFNACPHIGSDGKVQYITGTARDITEQKAYETELTYQAQHDKLTGLQNRSFFQEELECLISRIGRRNETCALIYLDLDQFKYVNDTIGHAAGDDLLIEVAQLLKDKLRDGDLLARFGGDEFTILLYDTNDQAVEIIAHNLLGFFESYKFYSKGQHFNITCSMGITYINKKTKSAESALSQADIACNMAKTQGRNTFHIYDVANKQLDGMTEDIGWASRVKSAYENDLFSLVYQPIISVHDGKVEDYEVLLRMDLDDGQRILPGGFIPAAERFGLINNVDRWTVRSAMRALVKLHEKNSSIRFAINLSGRAFEDKELLPMIQGILDNTKLEPTSLTFEITETAAIANLAAAKNFIAKLKDMGCQFALDDFGTGFCSFAYLKNLPVDKLKIDGSFVQSLDTSKVDRAMVKSMHQIAHALDKKTIAEFVQNEKTLNILKDYGVDFAQGHHIGKPLPTIDTQQIFIPPSAKKIIYS
ncbi:MAG: EAL domain-containing protein [Gammaproteobacteria bacterium]|nr:EAL domain-containing protein [Gammaproteobacteria bacterium]